MEKHRSNEPSPTTERGDEAYNPAIGRHATSEERGETPPPEEESAEEQD